MGKNRQFPEEKGTGQILMCNINDLIWMFNHDTFYDTWRKKIFWNQNEL